LCRFSDEPEISLGPKAKEFLVQRHLEFDLIKVLGS
jgi:hypothetical protein